jgi:hypothetical protein
MPVLTADNGTPTARVIHKGSILQVFLAPWKRILANGQEREELHLHVQDEAGGAGKIVTLDSPLAQELAAFHPEIADLTPAPDAAPAATTAETVAYEPPPRPPAPTGLFGRLKG